MIEETVAANSWEDYVRYRLGSHDLGAMTPSQIRGRMIRIRNLIGDSLKDYSMTARKITEDDPRDFLNSDEAIFGYRCDLKTVLVQTEDVIKGLNLLMSEYRCCREVLGIPDQSFEPVDQENLQALLSGGISEIRQHP